MNAVQALQDLVARFAISFDLKDWDRLGQCLSDSLHTDYRDLRGTAPETMSRERFVALRREALQELQTHHLAGSVSIDVSGRTADMIVSMVIFRRSRDGRTLNTHCLYYLGAAEGPAGWQLNAIRQKVLIRDGDASIHAGIVKPGCWVHGLPTLHLSEHCAKRPASSIDARSRDRYGVRRMDDRRASSGFPYSRAADSGLRSPRSQSSFTVSRLIQECHRFFDPPPIRGLDGTIARAQPSSSACASDLALRFRMPVARQDRQSLLEPSIDIRHEKPTLAAHGRLQPARAGPLAHDVSRPPGQKPRS